LFILAAIENELFLFYFHQITRGSGGGTFNFNGSAGQRIRLWAYFKDEFDYIYFRSVTTLIDKLIKKSCVKQTIAFFYANKPSTSSVVIELNLLPE
jgi:hypothetical protein